ncbi:hypothetical protein CDAR_612771 [Caerostris darwini]|uniref:Elongin-C n=1 Tax=Caerostris darwini TaxID=1538125 RepID=A0AAV4WN90_9ARAC|nr:hypothetical protein CDAR_612771 [Caerostris darwini]
MADIQTGKAKKTIKKSTDSGKEKPIEKSTDSGKEKPIEKSTDSGKEKPIEKSTDSGKEKLIGDESNGQIEGRKESCSKYVKIISSDGHEFYVKREHAFRSKIIRDKTASFDRQEDIDEIHFDDVQSHLLLNMCQFMVYRSLHRNDTTTPPAFVIEPEKTLDLITVLHDFTF